MFRHPPVILCGAGAQTLIDQQVAVVPPLGQVFINDDEPGDIAKAALIFNRAVVKIDNRRISAALPREGQRELTGVGRDQHLKSAIIQPWHHRRCPGIAGKGDVHVTGFQCVGQCQAAGDMASAQLGPGIGAQHNPWRVRARLAHRRSTPSR